MDLRPTSNAAAAAKIGNPEGCFLAGACGVAPQSQDLGQAVLRRAWPADRQKTARPSLILL
jgi:hypothetical protein